MMRATFIGSTIAGLMMTLTPVAAQEIPDRARHDRMAFGSWIAPTGEKGIFHWYVLEAFYSNEQPQGEESFVVAPLKGRCKKGKRGGWSCSGRGPFLRDAGAAFEIAPDGSSATIDFSHDGNDYRAQLATGPTPPGTYGWGEMCSTITEDGEEDSGEGQGGGLFRLAKGDATWDGRKVTRSFFSFITTGVVLTSCDGFWRVGNEVFLRIPPPPANEKAPLL